MIDGVLGGGPIAFSVAGDTMPRLTVVQLNEELVQRFDRLATEAADAEVPPTRESLMEQALTRFATEMEQEPHCEPR